MSSSLDHQIEMLIGMSFQTESQPKPSSKVQFIEGLNDNDEVKEEVKTDLLKSKKRSKKEVSPKDEIRKISRPKNITRGKKKQEKITIIEKDNDLVYYFIKLEPNLSINQRGLLDYIEGKEPGSKEFLENNQEDKQLKESVIALENGIKESLNEYLDQTQRDELTLISDTIEMYNSAPRKTQKIKSEYINSLNKLKLLCEVSGCNLFRLYKTNSDIRAVEISEENRWKEISINYNKRMNELEECKVQLSKNESVKRNIINSADELYNSVVVDLIKGNLFREGKYKDSPLSKLTREELIDRIKEYKISNVLTEYSIGNENLNLKNLKEDTALEISKIKKEEYPEEMNRKGMKWSKKYGVLTFIPE